MNAPKEVDHRKTLEELLDEIEGRASETVAEPFAVQKEGDAAAASPVAALQLADKLPALMSVLGGGKKSSGKGTPDPQALLCALRPYLNDRRREAVDGMLQLWKIRALLQMLRQE
jgi:hypothetical protein